MTHATTALLLTAPIVVPLATSAAYAASGLRDAKARAAGAAALGHRTPRQRGAAAPVATLVLRPGHGPATYGTTPAETADGPSYGGPGARAWPGTRPGGSPGGPGTGSDGIAGPDTGPGAPAWSRGRPAAPAGTGTGAGPAGRARPGRGPRTGAPGPVPRPLTGRLGLVSPAAILTCGAALACTVPDSGPVTAYGRLLRADALTVWMLLTVGAVACLACAANPAHLAHERTDEPAARRYHLLVHAFLAAMSAAVLAANLGVLWVAIEATTIVTAFLVGHRRTRASVEAAWKYVVICSAGIALAFLGTVLLYYAARQAGIPEAYALDWQTLAARADRLDPSVTRLATGLVVLGFGAKAGLAPLHAWLPDAHSQAPAPVSALMSGVLLSVAFAGLLRYKVIADAALGAGFTRTLLAGVAVVTLALAAALLLAQRDCKRMLAYSSMEHMSLIALGTAAGSPLALSAVLLHMAGHGLAKTVAFCASGHIARLCGTTRIGRIRGLLAHSPCLGTAFAAAVVALLGLPPFGLFASELGIARAGFLSGPRWALAAALVLMLAAFAALAARTARMLLGPPPGEDDEAEPVPLGADAAAPLVAGLAACAALGVTTGPLTRLLSEAGEIIGGH
ncbi:proton-conducting transporter membrane subunit [Streptomyces klenkii]|uniref:proton-conducting transporter transmembrane domain-containing protein n=1 Tax=Streptomyces TaxID=1883 RepID=UPI00189292E7|nr:proton-conducting transporter membrane subunit [Streptomyces sp. NRRL B-1677]